MVAFGWISHQLDARLDSEELLGVDALRVVDMVFIHACCGDVVTVDCVGLQVVVRCRVCVMVAPIS